MGNQHEVSPGQDEPASTGSELTLWQRLWWKPSPAVPVTPQPLSTGQPANAASPPFSKTALDRFNYGAFRVLQWLVVAIAIIVFLVVLWDVNKINLPGVSPPFFYATLAFGAVCALLLAPPLFFRLGSKVRVVTYAFLITFFFAAGYETAMVGAAYDRTPAGAREASARAERRRIEDAEQAEREHTEQMLAQAADTEKQLSDYRSKAEGCFSWGHRLPDLERPVKDSMQNPSAFEHVKTELTVPDGNRNNVIMTFRAQNGFGAIRTATIRAQLIAEDCTIQNIGQPDVN